MLLSKLGEDELQLVAGQLAPVDLLAFSLAARPLNAARCASHLTLATPGRAAAERGLTCAAQLSTPLTIFHALHAHLSTLRGRLRPPRYLQWVARECGWLDVPLHLCRGIEWVALAGGDLASVAWLASRGCVAGEDAVSAAANANRVDMLEVLHALGARGDWRACAGAAHEGHIAALAACQRLGYPLDAMTCANAAGGGHVKVLEWARASGAEWDEWSWAAAAAGGHIHVMEWLMAQLGAPPMNAQCTAFAAASGQRAALEWARAHGAPWDASTTAEAAGAGDLALLRWCRERGCDWDEEAPSSAAANGHLHVLRYCREAGCPIDELEAVHRAQEEGHLDVVRWVVEHGDLHLPPWDLPEVWQHFGGGPQWPTPA